MPVRLHPVLVTLRLQFSHFALRTCNQFPIKIIILLSSIQHENSIRAMIGCWSQTVGPERPCWNTFVQARTDIIEIHNWLRLFRSPGTIRSWNKNYHQAPSPVGIWCQFGRLEGVALLSWVCPLPLAHSVPRTDLYGHGYYRTRVRLLATLVTNSVTNCCFKTKVDLIDVTLTSEYWRLKTCWGCYWCR